MDLARGDGRQEAEMRKINIACGYTKYAEGSVLIECGETKVICTASVEDKVPPFLRGTGQGWITGEYSMLPRATETRTVRESAKGRIGGRTYEIQRLIGRAIRSVIDLKVLGERTIWLDCDVIQADGGTRTAAITGAYVSLITALANLDQHGRWQTFPATDFLAAVSVGVVNGKPVLDLDFSEDSNAQVDMNVVMTGSGKFIEVQGTAEGAPFGRQDLDSLLALAEKGIGELIEIQKAVLPQKAVEKVGKK